MRRSSPRAPSLNNYQVLEYIDKGGFGTVCKARHVETGRIVAIKQFETYATGTGLPANTVREIALLKRLHENVHIVTLLEVLVDIDGSNVKIVLEYCTQDLKKYLNYIHKKAKMRLSIQAIKSYLTQILEGIAHCHSLRIIHRDLKPQNILLVEDPNDRNRNKLQIADFGLSRTMEVSKGSPCSLTHEVNTLWYRSPEILLGQKQYDFSSDIWSIGCIFGEMLNASKPLFRGDSEICQIMHIFKVLGTPNHRDPQQWPQIEEDCKNYQSTFPKWNPMSMKKICPRSDFDENGQDLLARMLTMNPRKRITARQALRHCWLKKK